jgi:hypothetical protein
MGGIAPINPCPQTRRKVDRAIVRCVSPTGNVVATDFVAHVSRIRFEWKHLSRSVEATSMVVRSCSLLVVEKDL